MKKLPLWFIALLYTAGAMLLIVGIEYLKTDQLMSTTTIAIFLIPLYLLTFTWEYYERQHEEGKFKIKGWKWIFYILGFLGFINLLFWLIAIGTRSRRKNKKEGFMESIRVLIFMWGILMSLIVIFVGGVIIYEDAWQKTEVKEPILSQESDLTIEQQNVLQEYNAKVDKINVQIKNLETNVEWLANVANMGYQDLYEKNIQSYNELYESFSKSANDVLGYIDKNEKILEAIGLDVESERANLKETFDFYKEIYETVNNQESQQQT